MPPDLPSARLIALFLDIDGTMLDFAPTPDSVVIPPDLPDCLRRLRDGLGGALGLITGRAIEQTDQFFPGLPTAIAGEHGAVIRHQPNSAILRHSAAAPPPPAWLVQAEALAYAHPGTVLERKSAGFGLHFRGAPNARDALHAGLESLLADNPADFHLLPANMAWEIKARGIDKGTALRRLMAHPPFIGRLPIFIGDDLTDHDAIDAARQMGGRGFLVPEAFGGPAQVRAWLRDWADRLNSSSATP